MNSIDFIYRPLIFSRLSIRNIKRSLKIKDDNNISFDQMDQIVKLYGYLHDVGIKFYDWQKASIDSLNWIDILYGKYVINRISKTLKYLEGHIDKYFVNS